MLKSPVDFKLAGVGCLILKYKQQNHKDLSVTGEKSTSDSSLLPGLLGDWRGSGPAFVHYPGAVLLAVKGLAGEKPFAPSPCLLLRRMGTQMVLVSSRVPANLTKMSSGKRGNQGNTALVQGQLGFGARRPVQPPDGTVRAVSLPIGLPSKCIHSLAEVMTTVSTLKKIG